MKQVEIEAAPLEKLASLLGPGRAVLLMSTAEHARSMLDGVIVWNVNSTALGGGVAEMLEGLLAYGHGARVDTRWLVLDGDPLFFDITKRLHNALHGFLDDRHGFSSEDHEHYERVSEDNLEQLQSLIRAGDIVLLHDPQTAGLVDGLRRHGAHVVWRSHIGRDEPNAVTAIAWEFLRRYVEDADALVFSRREYVPDWLAPERVRVINPSIDPFTTKNRELYEVEVSEVLGEVGLVSGAPDRGVVRYTRRDGMPGVLRPHTGLLSGTTAPPFDAPLVLQVSRWDRLKDMEGVLRAFAAHVAPAHPDAHLMLAGPDVSAVSDDPEGAETLAACRVAWADLPAEARSRCHLATLPMDDPDENALIVNALQRHATVVVQKSLAEGFGLTLMEAMWKGRPVVASAVGGLQEQVDDGVEGLLLPDPTDLAGFGERVHHLLDDPDLRERMGKAGRDRVRRDFLGDRHLIQWVELFGYLLEH
jgi:trehalose synthase